jgi:hypothetical protein
MRKPHPLLAGASWQSGATLGIRPFPLRTRRAEHPLVALPVSGDLFICAKHLLVAAKKARTHGAKRVYGWTTIRLRIIANITDVPFLSGQGLLFGKMIKQFIFFFR